MQEIFIRVWQNLLERTEGPLSLRFFLQPAMSVIFAVRASIRDSRNDTVPFLWRYVFSKGSRVEVGKEAWKDVGTVFIICTILDIIYQLIVIFKLKTKDMFYPLESIIVAMILAIIPYILIRGPLNRVIRMFSGKKKD